MIPLLHEIAGRLELGSVSEPPRQLSGGFLHSMYGLITSRGHFAVKLLNPHIMARPGAMDNLRRAESLEALLEGASAPILPALRFRGEKMQELDGQYFYVFDWFDGRSLRSGNILPRHCRKIAAALAQIHAVDRRSEAFSPVPPDFGWDFFTDQLPAKNAALGALLLDHLDMLRAMQLRAAEALSRLPAETAVCHNDMDSKNVLWRGNEFKIIDLECLGRSNPYLELYETALCWSGIEECSIDSSRFSAFLGAYREAGGPLAPDWTVIHDANTGRLGWLEYNLRRAMGIDCCEAEIPIGESEVKKTLAQLRCCEKLRVHLP